MSLFSVRRRRLALVRAGEPRESGAACVAMVLAELGRPVPVSRLMGDPGFSDRAPGLGALLGALRGRGVPAEAHRAGPEGLARARLPAILMLEDGGYAVLERVDARGVRLADPLAGRRRLSWPDLAAEYAGIAIDASPEVPAAEAPPRRSGGRAGGPRRRWATGSTPAVAYLALAEIAGTVPVLAVAALVTVFVDGVLIAGLTSQLPAVLAGLAVATALAVAILWLRDRMAARLETALALGALSRVVWHLLRLPVSALGQRAPGEAAARIAALDRGLRDGLAPRLAALAAVPAAALLVAAMAAIDWRVTLAAGTLSAVGAGAGLVAVLAARDRQAARRLAALRARVAGIAVMGLARMEAIRAAGHEDAVFARWAGAEANALRAEEARARIAAGLALLPRLVAGLVVAGVLCLGALQAMAGALSIGLALALLVLAASLAPTVERLVALLTGSEEMRGAVARAGEILDTPTDPRLAIPPVPGRPETLQGRIEIRDLVFGHDRAAAPLIDGLSLAIEPGQRVALVGATGSGKSTLARLIAGIFTPWSGEILLDGRPIASVPQAVLVRSLALVEQDVALFAGTVRENLSMWDASVDERAITRALRDAAVLDVVERRPGRYDALVAPGGANFSGGQRQRLEIARALVGDPAILLLDQATAALDPELEARIEDALRRRGCTTIAVAHRLSSVRDADEIIVLERGRIVERGIHEAMIAADGPYRRLMQAE